MTKPTPRTETAAPRIAITLLAASTLTLTVAGCTATKETSATSTQQSVVQVSQTPTASATAEKASLTLKAFLAAEKAQLPGLKKEYADMYSDIRIFSEGSDTLVYEFDYVETLDAELLADELDALLADLQAAGDAAFFPAMLAVGVDTPKVRYTYFNGDGSRVWSKTFTPS